MTISPRIIRVQRPRLWKEYMKGHNCLTNIQKQVTSTALNQKAKSVFCFMGTTELRIYWRMTSQLTFLAYSMVRWK